MADTSVTSFVIRIGVVVLAIAMILFMFGRPALYPLWTVGLIAIVGGVAAFSLVQLVRD